MISWGTEPSAVTGTVNMFFFASSTPFLMAVGTSADLPMPTPTRPLPSPTTTRAESCMRRPPLTVFATRLMKTTRS